MQIYAHEVFESGANVASVKSHLLGSGEFLRPCYCEWV